MSISIVWLRRNLRLDDNNVLARAVHESEQVVPLYLWDSVLSANQSPNQLGFISESVAELITAFEKAGSRLVIRNGNVNDELTKLIKETGATEVYIDRNYESHEIKRDRDCKKILAELGVAFVEIKENVLFDSGEVKTKEGKPYTVFTPFKKSVWERIAAESAETICPNNLKPTKNIASLETHTLPDLSSFEQSTFSEENANWWKHRSTKKLG